MPSTMHRVQVSVRMGLRARAPKRDAALVAAVAADAAVVEAHAGRDIGDMKQLDDLQPGVRLGLAVPEGGRLLVTALIVAPHQCEEAARTFAEAMVLGRLAEELGDRAAETHEPVLQAEGGARWHVESHVTTATHLFSYLGEYGPPMPGED